MEYSSFTGYEGGFALAIGGEGEADANILFGEVGEIGEDVVVGHAGGEVIENIINGDSQAAYARLAAALSGFDGDDLRIIHEVRVV